MSLDLVEPLHSFILPALVQYGFRAERQISGGSRAVILARIAPRICYYVIAKSHGSDVRIQLRIAPPQIPDDQITNVPGFTIEITQYYDNFDDVASLFAVAAQRLICLVPQLSCVHTAVLSELNQSGNQLVVFYRKGMLAYIDLQSHATQSCASVIQTALRAAVGEVPLGQIAAECVALVKSQREALPSLADPVFGGKARHLARLLASHFYIDAVTGRPAES